MKRIILAIACVALLTSSLHAAGEGKHLFILSGQSNMAGLNPKLSFIPAVEKEFGKENVIVVKNARSGKPIRCWYKKWKSADGKTPDGNGKWYDILMRSVNPAIKDQKIKTVSFAWMQGERDANEQHGEVYEVSFKGLIKQLEDDLGRKDINFVIGRLSDFDMENKKYPHWTMVRDIHVKLAEDDPRGAWVDTDDLNNKEKNGKTHHDLHYTQEGYKILGERFAEKAIVAFPRDRGRPERGV